MYVYIYVYIFICIYVYRYIHIPYNICIYNMCIYVFDLVYLSMVRCCCIKYKWPVSTCSEHVSRKASLIVQHLVVDHHFSFRQFFAVLCPYF